MKRTTTWNHIQDFDSSYEGLVILQKRDKTYAFVTHVELALAKEREENHMIFEYVAWAPLTPAPTEKFGDPFADEQSEELHFHDLCDQIQKGISGTWEDAIEHPYYKGLTPEEKDWVLHDLRNYMPKAEFKREKQRVAQAAYRNRKKAAAVKKLKTETTNKR